jgi:hypothetical protein
MLRLAALAILLTTTSASATTGELWSLYVYEEAVTECGVRLTEEQEDDLDAAQLRARLELKLSPRDAGDLYRRAREAVRASRQARCSRRTRSSRDKSSSDSLEAAAATERSSCRRVVFACHSGVPVGAYTCNEEARLDELLA